MKRFFMFLAALIGVYAAVELASLAALAGVNFLHPGGFAPSIDEVLAGLGQDDLTEYLAGDYHPLLGWDNKPGTAATDKNCMGEPWTESFGADGARSSPLDFDSTLIASYGDSYVKGGEVNDDQTWQFQLSRDIDQGVKNYAVGAYCTYQALLKARMHIAEGRIYPVTVLGINEQNIKRVVNLFRPFLYRTVSARLSFKPGIGCSGDECVATANLLRPDIRSIDEVRSIALEAQKSDYWARYRPVFEFPWSLNLFKLVRVVFDHFTEQEREPLWHRPEGIAAMHLIVTEFRQTVLDAGSLPVLLFIPHSAKEGSQPSYHEFKQAVARRYPDLLVLDVAETTFDRKRFRLKPANCHPSEYGHSVIAKTVRDGLERAQSMQSIQQ